MSFDFNKFLPDGVSLSDALLFALAFSLVVLAVIWLVRRIFGKDSGLKQALVSSLGILVLYGLYVVICTFDPAGLRRFTAPLPYVRFGGGYVTLFDFSAASFPDICVEVLSMLLLAYLVNQIGSFAPSKVKPLRWLITRLLCAFLSIFVHYLVYGLLNKFVLTALPGPLVEYAPMILVSILLFMFLLGLLKFILGLFLTVVNPLLGGVYAFFFMNKIGKNISRAIGTTTALTLFTAALRHFGCASFSIAPEKLVSYIPFCLCIMLLWFITGHKM